jgi:hypothetical protein
LTIELGFTALKKPISASVPIESCEFFPHLFIVRIFQKKIPERQRFRVQVGEPVWVGSGHRLEGLFGDDAAPDSLIIDGVAGRVVRVHVVDCFKKARRVMFMAEPAPS